MHGLGLLAASQPGDDIECEVDTRRDATAEGKLVITYGLEWPPQPKNTFECYDRDGKLLWAIASFKGPEQADDPSATNICGDFTLPVAGNVIGGWNWHMNFRPYLITSDGLYVGYVLDAQRWKLERPA